MMCLTCLSDCANRFNNITVFPTSGMPKSANGLIARLVVLLGKPNIIEFLCDSVEDSARPTITGLICGRLRIDGKG